ncbi:MAG: hypothetical protein AAFZ18_27470, partial [Myxococcota bacterium]
MIAVALRGLPPWLAKALKHPMASAAALTLGIRMGQELYRLRAGELSREDFEKRFGQHLGALVGTLSGASAGARGSRDLSPAAEDDPGGPGAGQDHRLDASPR